MQTYSYPIISCIKPKLIYSKSLKHRILLYINHLSTGFYYIYLDIHNMSKINVDAANRLADSCLLLS